MTDQTTIDPDLQHMMRDVLRSRELNDRLEQGVDDVHLDHDLWKQLDELGLTRLTLPEAAGGSGASWLESAALLAEAAAAAIHLPLAESDLLAGWLLNRAGLPVDGATRTVAVLDHSGRALGVSWASAVDRLVVVAPRDHGSVVTDLAAGALDQEPASTSSGIPRSDVSLHGSAEWTPIEGDIATQLFLRGSLVRAIQSVGAMERVLELCVEHTTTRVQFGRPLAKFQAVQHMVADIAAEVTLARAAVDAAVTDASTTGLSGPLSAFRVAVARSCAGHASTTVVRNAHQVHGAIGTTVEHPLQLFTHPLLDWRSEFGGINFWDRVLGTATRQQPENLWDLLTGGITAGVVGPFVAEQTS